MRAPLSTLALCLLAAAAAALPVPTRSEPRHDTALLQAAAKPDGADDTDFLFQMGMLEGHLIVGHELVQSHHEALGIPHFAQPVSEIYDDIKDYLKAKDFPPFDRDLVALEAAVTADPHSPATEAKYQTVMATVRRARDLAPASLRNSIPEMIKICADTIDAASGEYGNALERGKVASLVEYHDSRGYLEYVKGVTDQLAKDNPDPQSQALIGRFQAVSDKAWWIVDPLIPDAAPRATVSQYRDIAAEAAAIAKP